VSHSVGYDFDWIDRVVMFGVRAGKARMSNLPLFIKFEYLKPIFVLRLEIWWCRRFFSNFSCFLLLSIHRVFGIQRINKDRQLSVE
jgi:hypothetical protein